MMKRLLAMFLVLLTLGTMFGISASATYDEPAIPFAADAPQAANELLFILRMPRGMLTRAFRYENIMSGLSWHVQDAIWDATDRYFDRAYMSTSQLDFNISFNRALNAQARELRNRGHLNFFTSFFSWLQGQLWWLWAPVLAVVAIVFLWEPIIAPWMLTWI